MNNLDNEIIFFVDILLNHNFSEKLHLGHHVHVQQTKSWKLFPNLLKELPIALLFT